MVSCSLFQVGAPGSHRNDYRAAHCREFLGLFALVPITERFALLLQLVEHYEVIDLLFQVPGPGQNAFDASRVGGDDANACYFDSLARKLRVNFRKPAVGNRAAACSHVGQNDVALSAERQVYEAVKAVRVWISTFSAVLMPKVEAAFRPILGIEIRKGHICPLGVVIVIEA